ncbi:MAG: hypothetical protein ABIW46_01720 [Acidimicrobiales bacterium]
MENIDVVASRQLALVTSGQLAELGLSACQIEHRLRTGRLLAVRRGVYRLEGGPVSATQSVLAAQLAAGPAAVVSHMTAAWLWGVVGVEQPDRIDLLTLHPVQVRIDGVRAHSTLSLPAHDRARHHGIAVTAPARTLVDCCGLIPALGRAVDDLLRRNVLAVRQLIRCVAAVPPSGRRRIRPMRAALADRVAGYDPGGSKAELDVLALIRSAGLPLPRQRYRVTVEGRRYELDFAYPDSRLGIEFDGWAYHRSRTSFDADRVRRNALQRLGWSIFDLTSNSAEADVLAIARAACGRQPAS